MKKISVWALMLIIIMLTVSSCTKDKPGGVDFGEYELTSEVQQTLSYDPSKVLDIDTSWQKAYALSYSYYDKKTGESIITEGKCGNYYQSLDGATNIINYLTQEDGYMMEYVLNQNTKTGTAAVKTEASIDTLYSGFSQLSTCDPYFPVYTNVTKVGDDFVGNRSAGRYRQQQTENGVVTKIAYVWIDDQYGFASKCELYDAQTQELQMRWELLSFTQNVNEDGVKINIDAYTLTTDSE